MGDVRSGERSGCGRLVGRLAWATVSTLTVVAGVAWVAASLVHGAWWWDPEASVPRDGRIHTLTLAEPGARHAVWGDTITSDPVCTMTGSDGSAVPVRVLAADEQVLLDEPWAAEPIATASFTAPQDGVVVVTCDALAAEPMQTAGIARLHDPVVYAAGQYGVPLLGLGGLLGILALLARPAQARPALARPRRG